MELQMDKTPFTISVEWVYTTLTSVAASVATLLASTFVDTTSTQQIDGAKTFTQVTLQQPIVTNRYRVQTSGNALAASNSGETLRLRNAAGFALTLPVPAEGNTIRFVVSIAPTSGNYTISSVDSGQSSAALIHGSMATADVTAAGAAARTAGTAITTVSFISNKAKVGDWVELTCDGVVWYLSGQSGVFDAVTFT